MAQRRPAPEVTYRNRWGGDPGLDAGAPLWPGGALERGVRRRRDAPTGASGLGVVAVAAAATALGLGLWSPPSGPTWPSAVAPIAAFVSRDRGLAFKRVVPVHLLAPGAFDARIAAQDVPAGAAARTEDRRRAAELRALGLLDGSVNLVQAESAIDAGNVLGYYDPATGALDVRGSDLTPEVRVTIAHELTHALEDQHFGLNRLDAAARPSGAKSALDALEEGDAVLDEDDYLGSLPWSVQRREAAQAARPAPAGPAVAAIVDVEANVPYVLGPDLVEALYAAGGNRAIDRAFADPPRTELDVLNPADDLGPLATTPLAPPRRGPGERPDGAPSDFGALTLYLTLASRLDAVAALGAADGWGGGSALQFKSAGRSCTRVDLTGRAPPPPPSWPRRWPGGRRPCRPARSPWPRPAPPCRSRPVTPAPPPAAGPRSLDHALTVADERNQNEVNALYAGAPVAIAGCVGDAALGDPGLLSAEAAQNAAIGPAPGGLRATVDHLSARLIARCEPRRAR